MAEARMAHRPRSTSPSGAVRLRGSGAISPDAMIFCHPRGFEVRAVRMHSKGLHACLCHFRVLLLQSPGRRGFASAMGWAAVRPNWFRCQKCRNVHAGFEHPQTVSVELSRSA